MAVPLRCWADVSVVGWRWISGHNNKWLKRLMSISMLEIVAMQFNEFLLPR
jgi:hypothetical protein